MEQQKTLPETSSNQLTENERTTSVVSTSAPASSTGDTFNIQNNQGRMVGGPVHGGIVVQGDYHAYLHDIRQAPSTSSPSSSLLYIKDQQQLLEAAQQSLKAKYLERFKTVYPFSFPFTFDIENTWVSLALKDKKKDSQATEDHAELLKKAFDQENMLIIEGNPATGKTSLMRRLAYVWASSKEDKEEKAYIYATNRSLGKRRVNLARGERTKRARMMDKWAKEKQELLHYDLVIYAEFREVREKKFDSVGELVLSYSMNYLNKEANENLKNLINDENFCKGKKILLLLDGYDESSLDEQCLELKSYLFGETIDKVLLFDVVITTRKGYLSKLHDFQGRFIFAEVLGFPTKKQKEIYISKHFLSTGTDYKENIAAVRRLLGKNKNLKKIATTPLFLTFICLVHGKIVDGTLVELYCKIIWWLIDRYQKSYPGYNIPALFGFPDDSSDNFKTIQDNYLHFPQLHRVAQMALNNLKKDVFNYSDCQQFNFQPIIEQVGLLRKEEKHDDSYRLVTSYFFPHRTIQEFLAAFYCFYSDDQTNSLIKEAFTPKDSKLIMSTLSEYQKFILRISLSDKLPVNMAKRKIYFENLKFLRIDISFDAFNTKTGFNNKLLERFISQCTNMEDLKIHGRKKKGQYINTLKKLRSTSKQTKSRATPMSAPIELTFQNLVSLVSLTIQNCTFTANSQLTFTKCKSLKTLKFDACEIKSNTISFAELVATDDVNFDQCTFEANSQLSFINCPSLKDLKFIQCEMKSGTNLGIAILPSIDTLSFVVCTFKANSQLSLAKCPYLKNLEFSMCTLGTNSQLSYAICPCLNNFRFKQCTIQSGTNLGIATLPAIDIVEFYECKIDLATWRSVIDQIKNSSVKCLQLSAISFIIETYPQFLHELQKCEHIEEICVKDDWIDAILKNNEEKGTANLARTAQNLSGLTSITIILGASGRRLKEENKERIEKAGQERNPEFLVKYEEYNDSDSGELIE